MHKILIIDDETGILELCKRILSQEGHLVSTAASGEEGLELLNNESFDLVLSDLRMPGIDGVKLLKKIKETSPETEVIIVTGQATIETAVESLKGGAFDYILKPFNISELVTATKKCLDYAKLRRQENIFRETTYLYQLAQEAAKPMSERALLKFILERMAKALNADAGSIYMLIPGQDKLLPMASYGDFGQDKDSEVKVGEKIAGWVAGERKPLLIQDGLKNLDQFRDITSRPEIVSAIVAPLLHQSLLLGVVCLNRFKYQTNYMFTEHDLESLQVFVLHATLIIITLRHQQGLIELDDLKSEFLANVSHELRTPLMAISGALELLRSPALNPVDEQKEKMFLDLMSRNADRMRYLVNDLLDFSRMETGKVKLVKTRFDLCDTVREISRDLVIKAQEKKIALKADIGPDEKIEVLADKERIKQVLVNLITNAVKFTPEGGSVTTGCSLKDSGKAEFYVRDTGIGIPKDKLDKIFEKFYQIDGSVSRVQPGFGLGLAIVKSIVESHDGSINVESELGGGTKFTVSFASQA